MSQDPLVLGIDLGTSGVRIAVIDSTCTLLQTETAAYQLGLSNPFDWRDRCFTLISRLQPDYRDRLRAISVDGTSGTLLACDRKGLPLSEALPYSFACPNSVGQLQALCPGVARHQAPVEALDGPSIYSINTESHSCFAIKPTGSAGGLWKIGAMGKRETTCVSVGI